MLAASHALGVAAPSLRQSLLKRTGNRSITAATSRCTASDAKGAESSSKAGVPPPLPSAAHTPLDVILHRTLMVVGRRCSYVREAGDKYHDDCFTCSICGGELGDGYVMVAGAPHCDKHSQV